MNTRNKGRKGHEYTEKYLQNRGWSTESWPHATIQWDGGSSGWHDMFCAKDLDTGKKYGGFDIIAVRKLVIHTMGYSRFVQEATFWQVKKTKRNPITPKLKREMTESADQNTLAGSSCYIIWWPDRVGPDRGKPVIWRCDDASEQTIDLAIQ